ncbi:MAG: SpaH/EbpB family LPXTG-anchored major pilin [Clostridiales Family XIII bacterium]|jgi:fimbrial isopeptide formation D2 family protein|nr:SpaH/EbpB family LPXTG-anchored major pilin [Clostridiales Family XIII bacterium]
MKAITRKPLTKRIGIFAVIFAMILTLSAPMTSFADPGPTIPNGTTEGSITIHKLDQGTSTPIPGNGTTQQIPTGANPLNGVTFDYIKVVPQGDANKTGNVLFTSDNVDYYKDSTDVTGSGTTADLSGAGHGDGAIYWDSLPLGLYLIHETPLNGYTQVSDFIVSIPTTIHGSGEDTLEFDVQVYPKNSNIGIEKGAADPADTTPADGTDLTDSLPVAVGDTVDWFITSQIPSGYAYVAGKTAYAVTDAPSTGLQFTGALEVRLNPTVKGANDGTPLALGTDYTVDPAAGPYTDGGDVTITFTPARLALFNAGDTIQVKISTVVLDSAVIATGIVNEAGLEYSNKDGDKYTSDTGDDSPKVFVGGLSLIKVDGEKSTALGGAKFKLVEKSSAIFDDDLAQNGYFKVGGVDAVATSGNDGYFEFKHLPYGLIDEEAATATGKDYWLVEIDAPSGYRLIGTPIVVTVDGDSYNDALTLATATNDQIIENFPGFEFPLTGGMGTLIFVVGGIVLIGLAGIVIASTSRRGKAQKDAR